MYPKTEELYSCGGNEMENPTFCIKHRKWEIITFDIAYLLCTVAPLIMAIRGAIQKEIFLIVFGIVFTLIFFLLFLHYRGDVHGFVAVYPDKIVEKKKHTKEVRFNDCVEMKYFKKQIGSKQTWYVDCFHFYQKDQTAPVLITLSMKATVTPHTMSAETIEVLTYIRAHYPSIKYTKENWSGTY